MRKAIVVTDDTKYYQLARYEGYPFLVLSKSEDFQNIKSDKRFSDFYRRTSFETVDPSQYFEDENNNEKVQIMDNIVEYLYKKGFDEIVILTDIKTNSSDYFSYILLLKKYYYLKISFETQQESIQYFGKGNHIIPKENSVSISLVPFTSCVVSLDYTIEKKSNIKLDALSGVMKDIKLFQRIVLLKVESGEVLLIRKLGEV